MTTNALYSRHAAAADRGTWSVERDIAWGAIDAARARRQPDLLAALREAALIESFHPVNLARLMLANWDDIDALVEFMLSEHLASRFFRRLSEQAAEPVLKNLLERIAADEIRHAHSAADLIAKRIAADPDLVPQVLDAATHFGNYGAEAFREGLFALHCDEAAIRTFENRIERLCSSVVGQAMSPQIIGQLGA